MEKYPTGLPNHFFRKKKDKKKKKKKDKYRLLNFGKKKLTLNGSS